MRVAHALGIRTIRLLAQKKLRNRSVRIALTLLRKFAKAPKLALVMKIFVDLRVLGRQGFRKWSWLVGHVSHHARTGRFPILTAPEGLNDFVHRSMVIGLDSRIVAFHDKTLSARNLPAAAKEMLSFADQILDPFPPALASNPKWILKTNHESGGIKIQGRGSPKTLRNEALGRVYGAESGEWPYSLVEPVIFVESRIPSIGLVPDDYKFHCSRGSILACQVIKGRFDRLEETMVDADGIPLLFNLDEKMSYSTTFSKPSTWDKMKEIASIISLDYDYVRVDLYNGTCDEDVFFGELTFFPSGGNYNSAGQLFLGRRLTKTLNEF